MRLRLMAAVAASGALALTAATAAGQGTSVRTGETEEGVNVKLELGSFGNPMSFTVGKSKVECDEGGTLTNDRGTYTGFDASDPGEFSDKRSSRSDSGQYHFKTKSSLSGAVAASGDGWSGKFKLSTKVFKRSNRIDTCRLKTTWDAS